MSTVHPKLIESLVEQTPRAMIAMLVVSSAYIWIYIKFIPLIILISWFLCQTLLALYRLHNARMFTKYLKLQDQKRLERNELYFKISNVVQAFLWTAASVLSMLYAPPAFELVSFVLAIGVITAAALSMSSLYNAYLIFFFCMIIPQVLIMIHYGEHQHLALILLTVIYIPATMLLSKAIYSSRLSSIKAHDELELSVSKFQQLSIIDSLTNIYNRRYFLELSQKLISIASREKRMFLC